jgi:hypothetical protein
MQDRSTDDKAVVQAFFGNFKTVETLGITKLAKPEGDLSPQQLLDWVLTEQKNNVGELDAAFCVFQALLMCLPKEYSFCGDVCPTVTSRSRPLF